MVKYIEASNFRSLGPNTRIDLGDLTVLVGPNGAGKSNVIDLFRFIADAMKIGLEGAITKRNGIKSIRRWSNGKPYNITISLMIEEADGFNAFYTFTISGHKVHDYSLHHEKARISLPGQPPIGYEVSSQKWITAPPGGINPYLSPMSLALPLLSGDERFGRLERVLRNASIYNIFPDTLRLPQKYDPQKPMNEHGGNWASILKDQSDARWIDDLVKALNSLTQEIDDLEVGQLTSFLLPRFRHGNAGESQKAKWFDASQESDGILRMAGLITALLQEPHLPLIGIEEPELTIHPGMIPVVFDYIKQASRYSQVVVTTHSPELLDVIKDVQQIRVVSKNKDHTIISPISEEQKSAVREGLFSIGEIHRTEGLQPRQLSIFEDTQKDS